MEFDAALTAWATLGLAVLALVAAFFALLGWITQSRQLTALRDQLREQKELGERQLPVLEGQRAELEAAFEQREREAQERREAYVSRIFIWHEGRLGTTVLRQDDLTEPAIPGLDSVINVRNAGEMPTYDVVLVWRLNGYVVNLETLAAPVMPGPDVVQRFWRVPPGTATRAIEITAFIRDANENRWRITSDGRHGAYQPGMLPAGVWNHTAADDGNAVGRS